MREMTWPERLLLTYLGMLGVSLYVVAWDPDWSSMDSSDVVALVAVIASAAVGGAGLLSGTVIAKASRTHATEMAIQDRRQARLEAAYVELLTFAAAVGSWAQALLPPVNGDPNDPARDAPSLPEPAQEWSMTAKVAAFGSKDVQQSLERWRLALREVQAKVRLVQLRDQRGSGDWFEPWGALEDDAKPAERRARERLQELVANELNELPRSR